MRLIHLYVFPAMWLCFVVYWWAMARNVKEAARREPAGSRLFRLLAMMCAAALLVAPEAPIHFLNLRFLPAGGWHFWLGLTVTATGLGFCVWARQHLGRNWSQAVTLKEGHELTTTGPYALARHPIYTGLLLALLGSALARGEWRGLLAMLLVFIVLFRKLRLEETWLRAQFGEAYEAYCRRVAALVPYVF